MSWHTQANLGDLAINSLRASWLPEPFLYHVLPLLALIFHFISTTVALHLDRASSGLGRQPSLSPCHLRHLPHHTFIPGAWCACFFWDLCVPQFSLCLLGPPLLKICSISLPLPGNMDMMKQPLASSTLALQSLPPLLTCTSSPPVRYTASSQCATQRPHSALHSVFMEPRAFLAPAAACPDAPLRLSGACFHALSAESPLEFLFSVFFPSPSREMLPADSCDGSHLDVFVDCETPKTFYFIASIVVFHLPCPNEVNVSCFLLAPCFPRGQFVSCVPQQTGQHWRSLEAERALGFPNDAELGQENESSSLIQMW